jgi:hypothetical protein
VMIRRRGRRCRLRCDECSSDAVSMVLQIPNQLISARCKTSSCRLT